MLASVARFETKSSVFQGTGAISPTILEGVLAASFVLAVPVLLYIGHMAPYGRLMYPALNFLLSGYLFARRSPWYVGHCLLVFCFVSLARRLIDQQAGWDPSNPVLLTPYLCCLFAGISFIDYWWRDRPYKLAPFLVILLCVAYGTLLAILNGRPLGSLVDALKWSVGPLMAVHMLAHRDTLAGIRRLVEPCLIWAGAAMAVYGIAQFISPAPWDASWMRDVAQLGLDSIGQPEPFKVRVFSTMNSPGSFGIFLSAGILLALKQKLPIAVSTATLMVIGLALSQYRSIWAATALALLMVVFSRRASVRMGNLLALFLVGCMLCSTALAPRIRETVVQRASTLTAMKKDASLESRLKQYEAIAQNDTLIWGEGLAMNGTSRRLDKRVSATLDGALIEIWCGLGVIVGTAFLLALAVLIVALFRLPPGVGNEIFFDRAIVSALFIQLPIGTVHAGELGFCAWAFLGLALATRINAAQAATD